KAFLQILLRKQDRDATRFLWLKSNWKPGDKVEYVVLRMKRVLFGAASSPFLLAATVKHHIRKYRDQNEKICQLINNNLYVDDFLGSDDSEEEVNCIKSISSKILLEAGMELTKWVSNSQKLIIEWNESICDIHNFSVVTDMSSHKVLGICWDLENDWLTFNVENVIEFIQMKKDTKRSVLQASSRIFDPLGFLSPYTVQVKVLFQCLWEKGIQWDEELTDDLRSKWNEWCSQLHLLRSIKVERCLKVTNASSTELHIFCDSSIFAYGAVAYMRCEYENCKVKTTFVMSKSRVAPLKKMTLPRLELMGALIGARLAKYLNKLFQNKRIHLWTDSMITLHWIRGTAKRWKPFVENRIAEIHEHTDPSNWSYCEGTTNPADKLTRGLNVNELEKDYLWWNGPRWLKLSRDQWPKVVKENFKEEIISNELRKSSIVSMLIPQTKESIFPLNKYSKLNKLIRVTSWILRFVGNLRGNRIVGELTVIELTKAKKYWIKQVQYEEFANDLVLLKINKQPKNEQFAQLIVFLDEEGLIRLKGRLQFSRLTIDQKHPYLLPRKSIFTTMVIIDCHEIVMHSGVRDTLMQVRDQYWISKGRQLVKQILSKCVVCKRLSGKPFNLTIAPLPKDRTSLTRPFDVTGLDFAGPLYVKDGSKAYIALFTCAVTRAVHLELVSSMNTEILIMSLKRFFARRGVPNTIYSDNGR
ncbi:uncharacterized protein B4U79_13499, partial [Dinothrombium tinctorium]